MSDRLQIDLVPTFREDSRSDRVGIDTDVDIDVTTTKTGLGVLGLIMMFWGGAMILIGAAMYVYTFPDIWYARTVGFAESKRWVEAVVLALVGGALLLLQGTAMYFFGRQVSGRGSVQSIKLEQGLEVTHG